VFVCVGCVYEMIVVGGGGYAKGRKQIWQLVIIRL